MSFQVFYNPYEDFTKGCLKLTAIIGKNRRPYWLCKDVLKVLGRMNFISSFQNDWCRVRDVTDPISFHKNLAQSKIIPHDIMLKLLTESTRLTASSFGYCLNHPETRVHILQENNVTDVNSPSKVLLCTSEKTVDPMLKFFSIWFVCFKLKVVSNLYGGVPEFPEDWLQTYVQNCDLSSSIVPCTEPFQFPSHINFNYEGQCLTYMPSHSTSIPTLDNPNVSTFNTGPVPSSCLYSKTISEIRYVPEKTALTMGTPFVV